VRLKIRHGMVVRGRDGLDEVTTTGATEALEVKNGRVTALQVAPERFGIARASLEALRGEDAARNAAIAREVLANAPSAARDIVVLNAGCAIYAAEQAKTLEEGVAEAQAALASGRAAGLLERVKELSTHAG
jgi:anthranilate phosphoribosyltransferase